MSFLTLDLETVPQWKFKAPDTPVDEKWFNEMIEESEGTGSVFSDEAVAKLVRRYLKSGEAKLKSTGVQAALHASTAHVVSVSWGNSEPTGDSGSVPETMVKQWDDFIKDDKDESQPCPADETFEAALIGHTFRSISAAVRRGITLVGFNTKGFDLPMLRWRAALLGLEVPNLKWDGPPYQGGPAGLLYPFDFKTHCDLRTLWTNGNRFGKGTLADMSRAFGIENEDHGADVYRWFRDNDWDKIRAYGHVEARNLIQLYRACERIL
jgi:hypothetical protein